MLNNTMNLNAAALQLMKWPLITPHLMKRKEWLRGWRRFT